MKIDEWLDEVNEQDEVIGQRRRSEIHQSNLRH
ncbi:MAG: NUDIX hydrolase, partial [Gammaproteobacteria bacterium]|nr:NUDIX hydrolase [Gammaproteobacteria bacterium]